MELKELLGEELYKQVEEKVGDKKLIINDGNYIPRERLNEKTEEIKTLEEQLKERDNQINQLKEDTSASDELKAKIKELQETNKETEKTLTEKLTQTRKEAEIEKALLKNKARNPKAVKALMDDSKLELTDDGVKGLDDQLKLIKENEPYLFEEEKSSRAGDDFKGNRGSGSLTEAEIDRMSEAEINANWDEVQKVLQNLKK